MFHIIRRLFNIMSKESKKSFRFLLLLTIVSAMVETFGIAFVFPFIAVLSTPDYIQHSHLFFAIYTHFGFKSTHQFLLVTGVSLLCTVLLGNILIAYSNYCLYRFSYREEHILASALLKKYLLKPYTFFLSENMSILLKNITDEIRNIVQGIVISTLKIGTNAVVLVVMLTFLTIYNALLTAILVTSIASLYIIFTCVFKKFITRQSKEAKAANALKYKYANEALHAIQDIKLTHTYDFILKQFEKPAVVYATGKSASEVLATTPRYFLDVILFGGILFYIIIMLLDKTTNLAQVVPTLAMFGYAGVRMMPAISLMYHSYSAIQFAKPSFNALAETLSEAVFENGSHTIQSGSTSPITFHEKLAFNNVSFHYNNAKAAAVNHLSFEISAYSTIGFVGKTGAGKTTIINLILGLLSPTSGSITLDGNALNEKNLPAWQSTIGYVPQSIYLLDDSIAKNIAFGLEETEINWAWLEAVAKQAELHDFITQELPDKYQTHVGDKGIRLSGGQKQRLGIARALYRKPKFLVLDEATSALDNTTEKKVLDNIHAISDKITTVMIAHRLTTLKACDTIFVLTPEGINDSGTYEALSEKNDIFKTFLQHADHNY
jgi:ABC-type multidrug transport system fused ATPase/permease subunit